MKAGTGSARVGKFLHRDTAFSDTRGFWGRAHYDSAQAIASHQGWWWIRPQGC